MDEIFGVVASPSTGEAVRIYHSAPRAGGDAVALGRLVARMLLDAGAGPLLEAQDGAERVSSLPLSGRRVLVTRAAHQAGKLSEGLRALGAEPVEVPVLEIRPPASFDPLDRALRQLNRYDWLILTSANTVMALAEPGRGTGDSACGSSHTESGGHW